MPDDAKIDMLVISTNSQYGKNGADVPTIAMPLIDDTHMHIVAAAAEALLQNSLMQAEGEFISVFDLHITDVIIESGRRGTKPQTIAHLERNPRGCKGKTHVKIQNGPVQCYENCASIYVRRQP